MAKGGNIENASSDLNKNLEADFNNFIRGAILDLSREDDGRERREAKVYITPDLIGDSQPDFQDEVTLTYAGSTRVGQIVNIDTRQGGQTYLFTLLLRF